MDIEVPKRDQVIGGMEKKGYPVSRTHFSPTGFKTDAPLQDVKDIIQDVKGDK